MYINKFTVKYEEEMIQKVFLPQAKKAKKKMKKCVKEKK